MFHKYGYANFGKNEGDLSEKRLLASFHTTIHNQLWCAGMTCGKDHTSPDTGEGTSGQLVITMTIQYAGGYVMKHRAIFPSVPANPLRMPLFWEHVPSAIGLIFVPKRMIVILSGDFV